MKLKAIDNLHRAGLRKRVPVVTIINSSYQRVRSDASFSSRSTIRKKIGFLSFQPVSFTGRDEAITDDRRQAQRYTLAHLAHDVKNQTGFGVPARDWYPISSLCPRSKRLG